MRDHRQHDRRAAGDNGVPANGNDTQQHAHLGVIMSNSPVLTAAINGVAPDRVVLSVADRWALLTIYSDANSSNR